MNRRLQIFVVPVGLVMVVQILLALTSSKSAYWDNYSAQQELDGSPTLLSRGGTKARTSVQPMLGQLEDLQFVHIPKTAGTAIEEAGRRRNFTWGFFAVEYDEWGDQEKWPFSCAPWHMPPRYFQELEEVRNWTGINIFANRTLFTVVRNPYQRIISEYYYYKQAVHRKNKTDKIGKMNRYVNNRLKPVIWASGSKKRAYFGLNGHLLPQYDYVFDANDNQVVRYVLRYENLVNDFNDLLERHGEDTSMWEMESSDTQKRATNKTLTAADLKQGSLDLINRLYKMDFEKFGYEMILTESPGRLKDLQFVHIPRTGGAAIELAGKQQKYKWGYLAQNKTEWGPAISFPFRCVPWHIPPRYFEIDEVKKWSKGTSIYSNRTLFTVVRNPYDRLISEYYYYKQVMGKMKVEDTHQPKMLEKFINTKLLPVLDANVAWDAYFYLNAHLVPQYDYVFDAHGAQIVQYVLKYENLTSELYELVLEHGDDRSVWRHLESYEKTAKNLTVANLTQESLDLIHRLYKMDFEMFGYKMVEMIP